MSFILDALKKSENERQANADVEFATVPSGSEPSGAPRWIWLLAALLLVNVVVLIGIVLRPEVAPPGSATERAAPAESPHALAAGTRAARDADADFAAQLDDARRQRPVASPPVAAPPPQQSSARAEAAPAAPAYLPSMTELILDGTLSLPPLHLDIHVFSDVPAERFVFINMNKYREGQTLSEGPELREITRDGVVLDHRGTAFVLPRE